MLKGEAPAPIATVAAALGLPTEALFHYGPYIAKVDPRIAAERPRRGRLVLVTAMTPTPAGEGKTTTSIGLADGLRRIGLRAVACLREPSLGPRFGAKGGATGGGRSRIEPSWRIDLHFTGDMHAVGAAHNLLAALIDNHLHGGNGLGLDVRRIAWRRVVDMNDRALRHLVLGLGGPTHGVPREGGFDITPASEVMAILCLARDLADLRARLGRIVVGQTRDRRRVTAEELGAAGAMAALLVDALCPNLVQSREGTPVFVHGGPFANIAHGCNSLVATDLALRLADVVVTEAGFGADLGAEKFFDIKCRVGGLVPDAAVLVATLRALRWHGGAAREALAREDAEAEARGFANLARHVACVRRFGVPVVVAFNRFASDSDAALARAVERCRRELRVEAFVCEHFARGSAGIEPLARHLRELFAAPRAEPFRLLYEDDQPLFAKIRTIATTLYGAAEVVPEGRVARELEELEEAGFGRLPVCIAKTQFSFSADPARRGAPEDHLLPIREVRLAAGAGFVVAICGDIMTMPGLPRRPAALAIDVDPTTGRILSREQN